MPAATSISLIISPCHVGIYNHRVGAGPLRIQPHNIVDALQQFAPVNTTTISPVDEFEGEIGRSFEIFRRISNAVSAARSVNAFPIVLSGNCNASVGVAAGLGIDDLSFVWFDAHDDLDTPDTNVNGYIDAMGVSMLAGRSWRSLMATVPDLQRQTVTGAGVDVIWGKPGKHVDFSTELSGVLDKKAMGQTLIHLDLDCLDELLGRVNEYPSPGGLLEEDVFKSMSLVPTKVQPVSLTVCSFNPNLGGGDRVAEIAIGGICYFVESLGRK
ncbi:arginase [Macrophomina phaseolina]|uniref:Arginase n=1 Tax=Macrophomina phaseolina TaxID=35725 RepID=A0ABQ8G259_9PEZI|nr:arginase [Macrophomina phaseolina]